mgnify:CR=1 FL=1
MKKYLGLLIIFLLLITGCTTPQPSKSKLEMVELTFQEKTLSWNKVADAEYYEIYVNDAFLAGLLHDWAFLFTAFRC